MKESPYLGKELVFNGSHEGIETRRVEFSKDVKAIRLGIYCSLNHISISITQEQEFGTWEECGMTKKEFWKLRAWD